MNRRDAIQHVAALFGVVISGPVMAGVMGEKTYFGEVVPVNEEQEAMLAELADVIIPTTTTPGAKAAGVEKFIVRVMRDTYPKADQEKFYAGLTQLNTDSLKSFGKSFVELNNAQKIEAVKALTTSNKPFFMQMKALTVTGYFTSEIGATQALDYVPIPGRFEGCIPLKAGQKAYAL